jgi:hypothetical protein
MKRTEIVPHSLLFLFPGGFGAHWASGIFQTIIYTKPVPLSGDKITQIYAEINFFPDSGHTHPLAAGCYITGKPEDPRPTMSGNGGPRERLGGHTDALRASNIVRIKVRYYVKITGIKRITYR